MRRASVMRLLLVPFPWVMLLCGPARTVGAEEFPRLPLEVRRAAMSRGDLIANGGFERGGDGWVLEGGRVVQDSPGGGALRLRASSGEEARARTEVAVIPGEHVLSAAIRLSGIAPSPGERVSDRLRVRVTWLDRSHVPLQASPLRGPGRMFQAGERPYPLFFLRDAMAFPWRRAVFLSSYNDPSQEDAPEGAAFARISFTLRGPGVVWLDDVQFQYSRRNFTLAERLAPWRLIDDDALGRVIPAPRVMSERDPVVTLRRFCLVLPARVPPGLSERLGRFEDRIRTFGATSTRDHLDPECDARVIVELPGPGVPGEFATHSSGWSRAGTSRLPGSLGPEGYVIDTLENTQGPLTFRIRGADARGAAYGIETLRQLLRPAPGGGAGLRAVTVRDWPAFRGRPVSESDQGPVGARRLDEASRWMAELKLNRLYLNYPLMTARWWEPPRVYTELLEALGARARTTGLFTLGVLVNPYFQRSDPAIADTFEISRPEDVGLLWRGVRRALDAGARVVMLCTDDFTPSWGHNRLEYALTEPRDLRRFGSLAAAHVRLARDLDARIRAHAPGAAFLFVPPWYNEMFREMGGGFSEDYLEDIGRGFPRDTGFVWTGPAVRSLAVDGVSLERFSRSVGGRPIVLWDNTLYALEVGGWYGESPLRARLASFFEPFAIDAQGLEGVSHDAEIYVNGQSGGRYRVKMATVADYLWNPKAYDPDRSLWRAMVARWGRDDAARVVAWDAAYWEERLWINRLAWSRGRLPEDGRARLAEARARSSERWNALVRALQGRDADLLEDLAGTVREQEARLREAAGLAADKAPARGTP